MEDSYEQSDRNNKVYFNTAKQDIIHSRKTPLFSHRKSGKKIRNVDNE